MARKSKAAGATPKPTAKGATPKAARAVRKGAKPVAEKAPHVTQPNEKYTPEQIIFALSETAGIFSAAARMLKCDRATIRNYIERYPAINEALEQIENDRIDIAEAGLINFLTDEKHPTLRLNAIQFYLRTKAKKRGYNYATEVTGKDGAPVAVAAAVTIDVSNLSDEQLAELERSALAGIAGGR